MTEHLTIAIDGPASSGKSTISKQLAQDLDIIHIDTGAMYRSLTWEAIQRGVDFSNEKALVDALNQMDISFEQAEDQQKVFINGQEVTEDIRSLEVTNNASEVSAHPQVREELVNRQRLLAEDFDVVMDGRDIGTVVLPDANYKIFLDASLDERAKRRFKENKERGIQTDFEQLKKEIMERDKKDSQRQVAPLKAADDAVLLDTTDLTTDQVIEKIKTIIKEN